MATQTSRSCCATLRTTSSPQRSPTCCWPCRSTATSRSTRSWRCAGSRRARRSADFRSASAVSSSGTSSGGSRRGRLFVITGPSGVGKGTLIARLLEDLPDLELSVSATTRRPRGAERDGIDYHFMDEGEFARRVDAGDFIEHADYASHRYGTLR